MSGLMIGVSTEQNTANATPAVVLGKRGECSGFMAVETDFAADKKWADGMKEVLGNRSVRWIDPVRADNETAMNIPKLIELVLSRIPEEHRIVWNLGGGQKAQQFALWEAFKSRNGDTACYADPGTGKIKFWRNDNGEVKEGESVRIDVDLTCAEILRIFNKHLRKGTALRAPDSVKDLMDDKKFRELVFRLSGSHPHRLDDTQMFPVSKWNEHLKERRPTMEQMLKKRMDTVWKNSQEHIDNQNFITTVLPELLSKTLHETLLRIIREPVPTPVVEVSEGLFGQHVRESLPHAKSHIEATPDVLKKLTGHHKFAHYFEAVVQARVHRFIETLDHQPAEALQNVEIEDLGGRTPIAEYDVLLATRRGTLVALDAKTFDVEKKDADARLHILERASGRFARFVPVYPYYKEDQGEDYIPGKVRNMPWKLAEHGITGCALMEPGLPSFEPTANKDQTPLTVDSLETMLGRLLRLD